MQGAVVHLGEVSLAAEIDIELLGELDGSSERVLLAIEDGLHSEADSRDVVITLGAVPCDDGWAASDGRAGVEVHPSRLSTVCGHFLVVTEEAASVTVVDVDRAMREPAEPFDEHAEDGHFSFPGSDLDDAALAGLQGLSYLVHELLLLGRGALSLDALQGLLELGLVVSAPLEAFLLGSLLKLLEKLGVLSNESA